MVILIDSWYTRNEVISNCRKRDYHWIGELKHNRVILYDGKRMHVSDLMNILRKGQFTDTVIEDGQIYQIMKVMAYIPSLKENVSIVIKPIPMIFMYYVLTFSRKTYQQSSAMQGRGHNRKLLQGCKAARIWRA